MAKEKIKCVVRGKIMELSPTAYEMAKDYFGAAKVSDLNITKPIELSKPILIPKINVKVEKPVELLSKESEVYTATKEDIEELEKDVATVIGNVIDAVSGIEGHVVGPKKVTKPVARKPRKK